MHTSRPAWHVGLSTLIRLGMLMCMLCAASVASAQPDGLRIGSKRFTESYILAEVLAQVAAPQLPNAPVVRQGLGNTAIVYEALRSGGIDLYAEYTGTVAQEILKDPKSGFKYM